MTCRKDVFQSKVLQKLYPAPPEVEENANRPPSVEGSAHHARVKRKPATEGESTQCAANPGRRVYTVAPPPADRKAHAEESVKFRSSGGTGSDKDSAEDDSKEENRPNQEEEEEEEEKRQRRRRRKRKTGLPPQPGEGGAAQAGEPSTDPSHTPANDEQESISKNKKRKLKKKRHKEKLRSMGLVPRAAALEFTYKKDGEEEEEDKEEEEEEEKRAAEVSDFLRSTMKLYESDWSPHTDKPRLQPGVVDELASSVAAGSKPASVLKQLLALRVLVQRREAERLQERLQELRSSSSMSAGETAAVVSLFQYWITDILPTSEDKKAELAAALDPQG